MRNALIAVIFAAVICLAANASASYYMTWGGSYGAYDYPNSNYYLYNSYWGNNGPYVQVSYNSYSPYHYSAYSYSGCSYSWCYHPAPYYYQPYYSTYNYPAYAYAPGYRFGYNW